MPPVATMAVGIAAIGDAAVGELPESVHPVAWFGRLVALLDRRFSAPRAVGAGIALLLPLAGAAAAGIAVWLSGTLHPLAGATAAGLVLFTTVSLRMLRELSRSVLEDTEGATERAREALLGLVGRDRSELSAGELRSAAVESLAENLADGLVGPLLAFSLGSLIALPVGAAAAVWVKAVNTLDSMLGYPGRPLGTASARLDDILAWLPARASAALIALAALDPGALRRGAQWAGEPASPNSGWPMATLAAVQAVRLSKPGEYDLNPEGPLPSVEQGLSAVRTVERAGLLAFAFAGVLAWF